ncbi:SsgA family sporulation/cell division regulator [Streptomyces olivaceus]|uniref:SsgA family sporulation/cell division regulator n=1 Tax=Streptomyces olivaceus TaxID=47716 RepID=UPI003B9809D1
MSPPDNARPVPVPPVGDRLVEGSVEAFHVCRGKSTLPLTADFLYDCSAPYEVRVRFAPVSGGHVPTTWTFARSLLEEGRRVPSGQGDVRIAPRGTGYVGLELRNDSQQALILLTTKSLCRFVSETYWRVPAGHKHHQLDLDAGLTGILGTTR